MDRSVCIRDKKDIGVVTKITYGGVQFKVTSPNGVLDPQPSPTLASAMTQTKTFAWLGLETDNPNPLTPGEAVVGPPSLDDLRSRIAQSVVGEQQATGPLAEVLKRGTDQARAVIEGRTAHLKALSESLQRATPPTLGELRNLDEAAENAVELELEDDAPAPEPIVSEESINKAKLLEVSRAVSEVADEELERELMGGADNLDSLDITALRKKAKEANIQGWREASQAKLIKELRKKGV